jgi:hypothetical protein
MKEKIRKLGSTPLQNGETQEYAKVSIKKSSKKGKIRKLGSTPLQNGEKRKNIRKYEVNKIHQTTNLKEN